MKYRGETGSVQEFLISAPRVARSLASPERWLGAERGNRTSVGAGRRSIPDFRTDFVVSGLESVADGLCVWQNLSTQREPSAKSGKR